MTAAPRQRFSLDESCFPSADEVAALCAAAGYRAGRSAPSVRRERYYDDPEGALRRRGLRLRRSSQDGELCAALEREGGTAALELKADAAGWPRPIARRLALLLEPETLRPWLELRCRAEAYGVARAGTLLARLSFIRVEAGYPERAQRVFFGEVELAAEGPAEAECSALRARLMDALPLVPEPPDRLERAEALLLLGAGFGG